MTFHNVARKRFFIAAVTLGTFVLVQPAFAIFGFGDIVFDPAVYGAAGQQIAQFIKLYQTAVQSYGQLKAEVAQIEFNAKQFANKNFWRAQGIQMLHSTTHNTYGETQVWDETINGSAPIGTSATAWNQSTVSLESNPYLKYETLGQSSQLANVATAEISDSASRLALDTLGQASVYQNNSANAITQLEKLALDGSNGTNSEIEQLNLLNGGSVLNLHTGQAILSIEKAQLQVSLINAKIEHDKATSIANFWANVANAQASSPSVIGNVAETFQSTRLP